MESSFISSGMLSTFLGYASICAWGCAQMPQLYENYRLGSAEGLALPFLISWFFGDLTNLIGCILTHQLPFQTYLATYFVIVDIGLVSQFTYYSWKNPAPKLPPFIHSHRHSHLPSRSGSRIASRRSTKRTRTRSGDHHFSKRVIDATADYTSEDPMERSWMSESSSVAHSPASTRPNTRPSTIYNGQSKQKKLPSNSRTTSQYSLPPTPTLSSHSEVRGRTLTRPVPTRPSFFGPPLETISGSPASGSPAAILANHSIVGGRPVGGGGIATRNPGSTSTSRTRPARSSSSMVFLSVGLLFTFSRWSQSGVDSIKSIEPSVVWSTGTKPIIEITPSIFDKLRHPLISSISNVEPVRIHRRDSMNDEPEEEDPYPYPKRDFERFIGRSSAWLCTSLYLTSRLPQIWQNFRRRSVEGLSMLLFIMAFVGNSLYVASILTNPLMSAPGYLLETTPYLLGSGGTLCFDITIVMQSLLYSEKREERRRRRILSKHSIGVEEAAALLQEDIATEDDDDDETGTLNGKRASQIASRSGSRVGRSPAGSRRGLNHQRSESTELARSKSRWSSSSPSSPYHSADEGGGILSDQDFDFESSSVYKGKAVSRPTTLSGHEIDAIMEEGESSVTLRSMG